MGKNFGSGNPVPPDLSNMKPSWRFNYVKSGTKLSQYDFPKDQDPELWNILSHLSDFEGKTIAQLRGEDSEMYSEYEANNEKLIRPVRAFLNGMGIERVHRFRISGTRRVFAFRDGDGVFVLIWWDPNHEIYPVEKKHT